MSGFTKEKLVEVERLLRRYLQEGEQLRRQINEAAAQLSKLQESRFAGIGQELTQALAEVKADSHLEHLSFTDMPWRARWRWLLTGKLQKGV